jgi:hypothetical protein
MNQDTNHNTSPDKSPDLSADRPGRSPVRSHVITQGRTHPTHDDLDHDTLLLPVKAPLSGLGTDHRRVMDVCQGGPLMVADLADRIALPVAVVKILVCDLIDSGHLSRPALAVLPAPELLKEVLDGLRHRLA